MATDARAEWSVDEAAQSAFVEISGDRNPIHVDPLAARRLPFGRVAVHGMHLVLDALERITDLTHQAPRRVKATFRHPVGIDDPLITTIALDGDRARARARVTVDVWTAAEIDVELETTAPGQAGGVLRRDAPCPFREEPEVHDIESLGGLEGSIAIAADQPHVTASLLALTRLVGMHVPGLRSLFSSFDVTITDTGSKELTYRVVKADPRFSQVVLNVDGGAVSGTLTAFARSAPVEQMLGAVRPAPGEFAGQRWLVVGGSRGLGALAVLLLEAGGADVRFTYHKGADDAGYRLDVEAPLAPQLAGVLDRWQPTHLAYMASPAIFVGAGGVYSSSLFERFRGVYVERFLALVDALDGDALKGVLWPSSVAVDHPPPGMAEYADAKREGETACRRLASERPALTVATPRFPRLLTDQTTSFVPVEFGDAGGELLRGLRAVTPAREH
jgi:acyl dehydratase